jgi:type I restriction enzyme S subunit
MIQKDIKSLITDNLDIWTTAIKSKSRTGRGSNKTYELYGTKKLRELILDLAVRGFLVPQDPDDEPASELLKRIVIEKEQLIKEGKIKKTKSLPPVRKEEMSYKVPSSWEWVRLGEIGDIFNGNSVNARIKTEKYTNIEGLPYIATKDVGYGFEPLKYDNEVSIPTGEPKFKVATKNSVLICSEGGSAGKKCGITTLDICFGNKLYANSAFGDIESKYILATYLSPSFYNNFRSSMTGIIGGISTAKFKNLPIAIPSIKEQIRIVAKIDELMALCDQLEQQTDSSIKAHKLLVENLLNALTQAKDHKTFHEAWQRIAKHFDTLFTTEHSIDQLKQTILQLAVMGKLVPQNPNDEPASELLKKIATEKEKLIKEGKIKKQKPLPVISEEEKPFELPEGWAWVRLQDSIDVRDGTHDSPKDAVGLNTFPLITSKNFKNGNIDFDNARKISEKDHLEIVKRSNVEVDDILFSMIGGNIGNQVIVKDSRPFSIKNVALFKYYNKYLTHPKFINIFTKELALTLQNNASGGAQPFVSLGTLRKLVVALPPHKEQKLIVAKVNELMDLCDQMKSQITSSKKIQTKIADTLTQL